MFKLLVEIGIAVAFSIIAYIGIKSQWKNQIQMKADYLRVPTSNTFTVLGLLAPIVIAFASYVFLSKPVLSLPSLLSALILILFSFIIAFWNSFSILEKATKDDVLTLLMPKDIKFIFSLSLIYIYILLSLVYLAIALFSEWEPVKLDEVKSSGDNPYFIARPKMEIGFSKNNIVAFWGKPDSVTNNTFKYQSNKAEIVFQFDSLGLLDQIIERKK